MSLLYWLLLSQNPLKSQPLMGRRMFRIGSALRISLKLKDGYERSQQQAKTDQKLNTQWLDALVFAKAPERIAINPVATARNSKWQVPQRWEVLWLAIGEVLEAKLVKKTMSLARKYSDPTDSFWKPRCQDTYFLSNFIT